MSDEVIRALIMAAGRKAEFISSDLKEEDLVDSFKKIGVQDAELWARSQKKEGINQLGRALFLNALKEILNETQAPNWIDNSIAFWEGRAENRYGDYAKSLKLLIGKGISKDDIRKIVLSIQVYTMFSVCNRIDDANIQIPGFEEYRWGLFEKDALENPIKEISGLHESLDEFIPN